MIKELEAYDVVKHLKNYYDRNKENEKWIIKGNILTTPAMLDYLEVKLLLDYINNLQKKAELGEHYKHLYSEVKKQKDDVVEYIKENKANFTCMRTTYLKCMNDLLRMLGEK